MMVQAFESPAAGPLPGIHQQVAMSRPQVGIERLPTRRLSNEPRESMNCKSCRKRKIKCNRLRPSCEACQVFQCPCIYDAVPKKRGPKTDVLEALLKRVDGLEQKLKEKKTDPGSQASETKSNIAPEDSSSNEDNASASAGEAAAKFPTVDTSRGGPGADDSALYSPTAISEPNSEVQTDALLDTYFNRFHAKPFHILDESTLRQRLQLNQVPNYLVHATCAVGARYTPHPSGYQSAVRLSEDYASRARGEIDTDEPSVDALQALLLLVTAFTAAGKGKKAYMLLTNAVGMAMALELHREMEPHARVTPVEREMRRRLFWTCYLLDRFMACGSKRPSLIADKTILLKLPCWLPGPSSMAVEGEFFQSGSNLQYLQGNGKKSQGSTGMLIDISRILGITNRYLAAGGVKGDSHFPWHSLSNLSKIRQDLDIWASGTEDVFSSLDTLFGQVDSTVLVLSKLVYHLIHCLVYRPFLPIDLAELAGTGQHQSWQIEATNMCFLHANAIAELVELGKQTTTIEWPAFVGYCICTAGTVHIHGAHYSKVGMGDGLSVFSSSAEFLSREMQQLSELRYAWASVQHQRETLQSIYNAHSELMKSLANNPMRYSPMFHLEDFFDRYSNIGGSGGPGGENFSFDAANLSLSDVVVDFTADTYTGHDLYAPRLNSQQGPSEPERPNLKRKSTASSVRRRPDLKNLSATNNLQAPTPGMPYSAPPRQQSFSGASMSQPPFLHSPRSIPPHANIHDPSQTIPGLNDALSDPSSSSANFLHPNAAGPGHIQSLSNATFTSPSYTFAQLHTNPPPPLHRSHEHHPPQSPGGGGYDPMFGGLPTNAFSSPAPWHGDDGGGGANGNGNGKAPAQQQQQQQLGQGQGQGQGQPSPGDMSQHNGSTGTGPGEEKDPFLSLLEQLAESESFRGQGGELDFFLGTGVGNEEGGQGGFGVLD
ncbi:fungal-specific transcription factor domain-containing protein [Coniochaeta sp. 2T2.1]|nr:fungal-specific transcription factor domain-containing protein [Coniochaeta sp. 2T2.1]